MSHFTVMVIGNCPDYQLARFDENLEVEEYEVGEVSDSEKERMLEHYREQGHTLNSFDECYEQFGDDWDGGRCRKDEDGIWQEYSCGNPDAKWDWYVLGGRWSGRILRLKEGRKGKTGESGVGGNTPGIDQARKKDIDFDAIFREAREKAIERYRKYAAAYGGTIPKLDITWHSLFEGDKEKLTYEDRRKIYDAQPTVQVWIKENLSEIFNEKLDELQCTEEEYAQQFVDSAISTYAYVKDGQWFGKGDMGWFGLSFNEKEEQEWDKQMREMIMALPDNTLISIFDCHI